MLTPSVLGGVQSTCLTRRTSLRWLQRMILLSPRGVKVASSLHPARRQFNKAAVLKITLKRTLLSSSPNGQKVNEVRLKRSQSCGKGLVGWQLRALSKLHVLQALEGGRVGWFGSRNLDCFQLPQVYPSPRYQSAALPGL